MATKCIDISDNKKIGTTSPIAMFAFIGIYIILTALMDVGFMYLILLILAFVFTQIFFQYKPRYIFLMMKYLTRQSYLTPSFEDKQYVVDEESIENVKNILNETEYIKKKQERILRMSKKGKRS